MSTQRWTLAVVSAATAMLMLDIAVVNTALSRIAEDLDTGLSGLQWVVDAYTLTLATTVLIAGGLADRPGRRRVFAVGMAVFTAASLACASAGSIEVLNAARSVQGVGGAILFAVSLCSRTRIPMSASAPARSPSTAPRSRDRSPWARSLVVPSRAGSTGSGSSS